MGEPPRRSGGRHSPHGECGLKSVHLNAGGGTGTSLPAWGVRVEIHPSNSVPFVAPSLPAWGVRVEMTTAERIARYMRGHSPHGECGLKFAERLVLPSVLPSHSPHGECGLKSIVPPFPAKSSGHSPHGECGLKSRRGRTRACRCRVTPRMGSAG